MGIRRRRERVEQLREADAYRDSGLTRAEFCRRRGISVSSLARWCAEEAVVAGRAGSVGFVEVVERLERLTVGRSDATMVVRLGEAVRLELPQGTSPEYVARLARAYQALLS